MKLHSIKSVALLCCLALLATVMPIAASTASAAQLGKPSAPVLRADDGMIRWTQPSNGVDVAGHNVHRGDGSYVTTVNSTDHWDAEGATGSYFVTAFDNTPGGAQISDRSNTVELTVASSGTPTAPDEPALPDGFVCGNWPPVGSNDSRDPVTLDAQDAASSKCGVTYDGQHRDRCDWLSSPAGWRCMIRADDDGGTDPGTDPGNGDGSGVGGDESLRDPSSPPPMPFDVRIRNGRLEWQMPASPPYVYQLTTNNSKIADGQPWTQREVHKDSNLTWTTLSNGGIKFSYPVDGFRAGTTFRVEAIHPYDIAVAGNRGSSSRFATVAPTNVGGEIGNFLSTFDGSGSSSIGGDWIGNRSDWSSTPQFTDDFAGSALSSQWYFADSDITPAYSRDQTYSRDEARVRNGKLEMTVDKATGQYSYLGTGNNQGDGYHVDASTGTFVEASVRLDKATPADNAWWAFWLMNPDGGAYCGGADTGTEVDIFELVPDQNNGFNAAIYRGDQPCGGDTNPSASIRPEPGDNFSYNTPDDIAGVTVPNYMDGQYHRLGMYYSHDRYAFYIDDTLIWQVTDPAFITKAEELSIRLTWELQNTNNPWTPGFRGNTTASARDDDPTVFVDWVNVWQKGDGTEPTEPTEPNPTDDDTTLDIPDEMPATGSGDGFVVTKVSAQQFADDFELEPDLAARSRKSLGDDVLVATITSLRGLRDVGLPEWTERSMLLDRGYTSWDDVPSAALDVMFNPTAVNISLAFEAAPEIKMDPSALVEQDLQQRKSLCRKSWKYHERDVKGEVDLKNLSDHSIPDLPDNVSASIGLDLEGVATLDGTATYRTRKVRTICAMVIGWLVNTTVGPIVGAALAEIPFEWEVLGSNVTATIDTAGTMGIEAEFAIDYRDELWTKSIGLGNELIPVHLFTGIFLVVELDLDFDLALVFEAKVTGQVRSEFDQEWRVDGSGQITWSCEGTDCQRTSERASFDFENAGTIQSQLSLDLKLIASADLNVKFDVDLYAIDPTNRDLKFFNIAKGQLGIVAQLPLRYFATVGNLCSDADNDGENERVQSAVFDLNLEIFAYVKGELFDGGLGEFLTLDIDWKWLNKKLDKPLYGFDVRTILYEKNIYFRDLSPSTGATALQPVLGRAGTWVDEDGARVEGLEILGTRSCYPLTAKPTYRIEWGDGTIENTSNTGLIRHRWDTPGTNVVRVRLLDDDAGRRFRSTDGSWVTTSARIGLSPPSTPPNIRTTVYSTTSGAVSWDRATDDQGVVGYQVIRDGQDLGTYDRLSYIEGQDPNQAPVGNVFTYEVYAVDTQGARSTTPAIATLDLRDAADIPRPAPPTDFVAQHVPEGVSLHWTRATGIAGYNVYRDDVNIATVTGTSFTDDVADGTYSYYITAFVRDAAQFSRPSATRTVTVVTPDSPTAGADNPDKPNAVVSLGDSFISGEGGRWRGNSTSNIPFTSRNSTDRAFRGGFPLPSYQPSRVYESGTDGTGECHRSDVAPIKSAQIAGATAFNLACSGAVASDVWFVPQDTASPKVLQTTRLGEVAGTHDIEMVVLSIGGNDLGFGDILQSCILRFVGGQNVCRNSAQREIDSEIGSMQIKVGRAIDEIRATLAASGDTRYRFVLQSYPSPLPRGDDFRVSQNQIARIANGCAVYNTDATWARDTLVPQIDAAIAEIAADHDVEFLSLANAFNGKEACAKGVHHATSSDRNNAAEHEWVRFVAEQQGTLEEALHPNMYGQQAMGRCIALVWAGLGPMDHACTNTGGTPQQMRLVSTDR